MLKAMRFLSLPIVLLILFSGFLAKADSSLSQIASEYQELRKNNQNLVYEIDGQRFVNSRDWAVEYEVRSTPWFAYGKETFEDWIRGAKWIAQGADDLPFDLDLYDKLERMVLKRHYFAGFEVRRIKAAVTEGKINSSEGDELIRQINEGKRVHFSGIDHSTLPGKFRTNSLDEFRHNGDAFTKDGQRYLTKAEIDLARRNPLLRVVEESLVNIGGGRFRGTIEYPRIKDLRSLTEKSFQKVRERLDEAKSLEEKIKAILEFRTELMTIHRSLDGNGRTVRLLADLLFLRSGLPPPAFPFENDIFGNFQDLYKATIRDMEAYVRSLRYRNFSSSVPRVLFHWSTTESYDWMLKQRTNRTEAPMQTLDPDSLLVDGFPSLADRRGTHAWHNPLSAMYGGRYDNKRIEWYVKPDRAPQLIGYFLKPDAKVETIRTVTDAAWQSKREFRNVDILYHQHLDQNQKLVFHEWIILNPAAIERWTTDPKELKSYIQDERHRQQSLKSQYPEMDRHFIDPDNDTRYSREVSRKIADRFLKSESPSTKGSINCRAIFH